MFIKQHRADYRCYFDLQRERGKQKELILAKKTNLIQKKTLNLVLGKFQYFSRILIGWYVVIHKDFKYRLRQRKQRENISHL